MLASSLFQDCEAGAETAAARAGFRAVRDRIARAGDRRDDGGLFGSSDASVDAAGRDARGAKRNSSPSRFKFRLERVLREDSLIRGRVDSADPREPWDATASRRRHAAIPEKVAGPTLSRILFMIQARARVHRETTDAVSPHRRRHAHVASRRQSAPPAALQDEACFRKRVAGPRRVLVIGRTRVAAAAGARRSRARRYSDRLLRVAKVKAPLGRNP